MPNSEAVAQLGLGNGIGDAQPMIIYENKAKERITAYDSAISEKKPDTKVVTDISQVHFPDSFADIFKSTPPAYKHDVQISKVLVKYPELKLFSQDDLGFELSYYTVARDIRIRSIDNNNIENVNPIIESGYDNDGFFIVANSAFKDKDQIAKGDPRKVPVNEITWQAFASVAKEKTKNLKVIFLMNIQNKGFWKLAETNYAERGIPTSQKAIWDRSDAKNSVWFDRFIGSDNINGNVLALTNQYDATGNKKLAKIITIARWVEGSEKKFTAALVLE